MTLLTSYQGVVNSPATTLSGDITDSDVTIPVSETSVFAATGANQATIGTGEDAETILYQYKSTLSGAGSLYSVTREFNKTGTVGVKKAWGSGSTISRQFTEYDLRAATTNIAELDIVKAPLASPVFTGTPSLPTGTTGVTQAVGDDSTKLATTEFVGDALTPSAIDVYAPSFTLSKDNGGYERFFFKDTFADNTIANYTLTGAPSIASGVMTIETAEKAIHTLNTSSTTGKWETVLQYTTDWTTDTQSAKLYIGSTSYLDVQRITGDAVYLQLTINGASLIAATDTTTTLADSTDGRAVVTYDGTNYQMYWNGVAVGAATAGSAPTAPSIGLLATLSTVVLNEFTFSPSVAFQDLFGSDTETRYIQLASADLAAWTAATATGVTVSGGSLNLVGADATKGMMAVGRSYQYGAGECEVGWLTAATPSVLFGYQDSANHYKVTVQPVAQTMTVYKVVAGTATLVAATPVTYTPANKNWMKVQWDQPKGQMWVYLRDNAAVYAATPNISDAFSSQYAYGKFGMAATVSTAAAGALLASFYAATVRASLLIGETNIPTTETGYYFRDEFAVDSSGGYPKLLSTSGTLSVTGGNLKLNNGGTKQTYYFVTNTKWSDTTTYSFKTLTHLSVASPQWVKMGFAICQQSSSTDADGNPTSGYLILTDVDAGKLYVNRGAGTAVGTVNFAFAHDIEYSIIVTHNPTLGTFNINIDGIDKGTITDATKSYSNGSVLIGCLGSNYRVADYAQFDDLTISGTRYYNQPMLRGAQIGEYYNGAATVQAMRFTDDFNWDTSGEYAGADKASWIFDTTNGNMHLPLAGNIKQIWYPVKYSDGVIESYFSTNYVDTTMAYTISWRAQSFDSGAYWTSGSKYLLTMYLNGGSGQTYQRIDSGVAAVTDSSVTYTYLPNTLYKVKIVCVGSNMKMYIGKVGEEYTLIYDKTDATYSDGYVGHTGILTTSATAEVKVHSFQINALDITSPSGISASLGGVPHGARYDVQEEAYYSLNNTSLFGKYTLGITEMVSATPSTYEMRYINDTDSTAISFDGLTETEKTSTTTYAEDTVTNLLIDKGDVNHTIKLGARKKNYSGVTYDNQAVTFINRLRLWWKQ